MAPSPVQLTLAEPKTVAELKTVAEAKTVADLMKVVITGLHEGILCKFEKRVMPLNNEYCYSK